MPTTATLKPGISHTASSTSQHEEIEADLDIDDAALAREYDAPGSVDEDGTTIVERVFGALDSGGLEDEGQDEDGDELDLGDDGQLIIYLMLTVVLT